MLPQAVPLYWKTLPISEIPPRWVEVSRTRTLTTRENCIVGALPSSTPSSPTKLRNRVSEWSKLTPGIHRRPVAGVAINIGLTVALKVSSFAVLVGTASMQTSMLPTTFATSTLHLLLALVHPWLVGQCQVAYRLSLRTRDKPIRL